MVELTVDMTYGQALFEAAREVQKTELIMKEAEELAQLFKREEEFFRFFCSPIISLNEKKDVIKKVFEGKISKELLNLLFILADKGRGKHFHHIVKHYRLLLNESEGFTAGIIYSVIPLTSEQLSSFEERTEKLLRKKVKLENKTDASIIGGVRIFIEGKIIDATVKKRLDDLRVQLQ